ncbi:hypothetical protein [Rugamonas sp.]|uniref:hypothetical protein n=1 Tax=Rugamonas sp. TaxID=1926287 RepID=UPI0025D4CD4D|nr:hypothetical protein [Rugamonas sp.]
MSNNFNAVAFAERLEEGGFSDMQAKTLAGGLWELVENHLATKEDLAAMEARLMAAITAAIDSSASLLRREAADARNELLAKISDTRTELIERIYEVELSIVTLKSELIMWGVGLVVVQTGVIAVMLKFLH